MSLLEKLGIETSIYVNKKIQGVLVDVEKDISMLEKKISDAHAETITYVDQKIAAAKKTFITKVYLTKQLLGIDQKIDADYKKMDNKKMDKLESLNNLAKLKKEILAITNDLDHRKMDSSLVLKLINNLNNSLTDIINALNKKLQDQIDNLELTKADKKKVSVELDIIRKNILDDNNRAINAENINIKNLNAEIARAKSSETIIEKNLNTEISRANDAETKISNNLNNEISRATDKENHLQKEIDDNNNTNEKKLNNEISRAKNEENNLQNQINKDNGDIVFNLNQEKQTRISEDNKINTNLKIQTGRIDSILNLSTSDKNSFHEIVEFIEKVDTKNDNVFAGYVVSNNKAVKANKDNLSTEITRAESTEEVIQHQLNMETARASKREKEITIDLNDEIARAKKAEENNTQGTKNEVVRATKEENNLQAQIDDLQFAHASVKIKFNDGVQQNSSDLTKVEKNITLSINNEILRSTTEDTKLSNRIDDLSKECILKNTDLSDKLTTENSTITSKIDFVNSLISQENIRADKEEKYLGAKITDITTVTKKNIDDLTDKFNVFSTTAPQENTKIHAKIDSMFSVSQENKSTLSQKIIDENTRATTAENNLDSKIDKETTRAITEEKLLQNSIDKQTSKNESILTDLQSGLNIEKSRIDSILTASTTDQQTFKEVVDFINKIDLNNDKSLPQIISNIKSQIKDVDNKIILETSRAITSEASNKKEILAKVVDILSAQNDSNNKLDTEITRAKNVEKLLQDSFADNDSNIKSLQKSLADKISQVSSDHLTTQTKTFSQMESFKNDISTNNTKNIDLINNNSKKIDDNVADLKATTAEILEKIKVYQTNLEKRLSTDELQITTITNNAKLNNTSLLKKLEDLQKFNTDYNIRLNTFNTNLNTLTTNELSNSTEIAKFKDFVKGTNTNVENINTQLVDITKNISTIVKEKGTASTTETSTSATNTEDLKKVDDSIIAINSKLKNMSDDLVKVDTSIKNIPVVTPYDDSSLKVKLSEVEKANADIDTKNAQLTSDITTIRKQLTNIISGSSINLDSFAEIVKYINSIDMKNSDIVNLVNVNQKTVQAINTKITSLDLKINTLKTLTTSIENISKDNETSKADIEKLTTNLNENTKNVSALDLKLTNGIKTLTDSHAKVLTDLENIKQTVATNAAAKITSSTLSTPTIQNVSDINNDIKDEKQRAEIKESDLETAITTETTRAKISEKTIENNIDNITSGKTVIPNAKNAQDAQTFNGQTLDKFLLKDQYNGLAKDGKAMAINGNTLSLTNSNGYIETVELPSTSSTVNTVPQVIKNATNSLRSSQQLKIKKSSFAVWQIMKSITLEAGIYNFQISSENYIAKSSSIYGGSSDDAIFVGQALVLPQGNFDSYGCLTNDNYNDIAYQSHDTNMFNLVDCVKNQYVNSTGQIRLNEKQEVRILLRSTDKKDMSFLLKTQLYKSY